MPFCYLDALRGTEIELPADAIHDLTAPGDCEDAARYWVNVPEIAAQLDALGHDTLVETLKEFGVWTEEELTDREWTRLRAIWISAGSAIG